MLYKKIGQEIQQGKGNQECCQGKQDEVSSRALGRTLWEKK